MDDNEVDSMDITDDSTWEEPVVTQPASAGEANGMIVQVANHASNKDLDVLIVEVPKGSIGKGPVKLS